MEKNNSINTKNTNSGYIPSFIKNVKSNNSGNINSNNSKTNNNTIRNIIIVIILVILICIIIYLSITIVHYYQRECYEKKTLSEYLFDFSNSDICIQETEPLPIIKKELPPKEKPFDILASLETKNEVFHIANQDYTYDQAKCKCESYNGRLATKAELIDSYNNGANWCTYGWTDKQSAYYPVQKCYWDEIQTNNERLPAKEKGFCGIPGINGGYFANPEIKFGVNCYGVKPKGQLNKIKAPYCPPMNFCKLEANYEASHKLNTDEIVGFNNEQWSM
jgi:hypothetical protein